MTLYSVVLSTLGITKRCIYSTLRSYGMRSNGMNLCDNGNIRIAFHIDCCSEPCEPGTYNYDVMSLHSIVVSF
jgi:hypothetical protein